MSATDMLSGVGGDALGQVGIAMLKKAQDLEAGSAAQLVAQLPQTAHPASSGPVGSNVDAVA